MNLNNLNLNNLNLNLMLLYSFLAAATTCFFAFSVGVKPVQTIFIRTLISFALFAVVGFLLGNYLKDEIEKTLAQTEEITEKVEETAEELPPLVLNNTDSNEEIKGFEEQSPDNSIDKIQNQLDTEELKQESILHNNVDDGSFDKVVVVNNDAD